MPPGPGAAAPPVVHLACFAGYVGGGKGKPVKDGGEARRHVNTGESRSWKGNLESRWTGSVVSKASMRSARQPRHEHGTNGATLQLVCRSAESATRLVEKRHDSSHKTMRRYMCSTQQPIGKAAPSEQHVSDKEAWHQGSQ